MASSHKSSEAQEENGAVAPIPNAKKSPRPKLSKSLKLEAHALALELMCQMNTDRTIVEALKRQYRVSHSTARGLLNSAARAMKANVDETTVQKRAVMRRRLEALYRRAFQANKLTVCAQVLRQLTQLEGLDEPIKVDIHDRREFGEGRSVEELNFYADHGCWPEEMPGAQVSPSQHSTSHDPLGKLPPVVH